MILKDTTFGVNTVGNREALQMCLASVLNAKVLPSRIQIRFEGKLPGFAAFYLEQLADIARFRGVEWTMCVANSEGVRAARDWQLDNCPTEMLWMGDDDAIYDFDCLKELYDGFYELNRKSFDVAYVCGSKADINNRRGYKDFNVKIHRKEDVKPNASFSFFYDKEDCVGRYAPIFTADTGNILINIPLIRSKQLRFSQFECSTNSGGEDTIFALECGKAGLKAFFVPSAQAIHLEKEQVNFNEFAARAEMVLRVCDLRGYSEEQVKHLKEAFMPWTFRKD